MSAAVPRTPPYTVAEAARELGVHPSTVYYWLRIGLLEPAPVAGNVTLVTAESVHWLKREREMNPPRRGRPRKKVENPAPSGGE